MDLDTINPRSIDVAHVVDKLSFRFFSEKEALRLSVRRLVSPHAFDELGTPISRGLYDPALGPASYEDPPCQTCGLGYNKCPGHFGHIELPISVPHPLLMKEVLQLANASCWRCPCLRVDPRDLNLYLARLYFEDAGMPKCGSAVHSFLVLRQNPKTANEFSLTENMEKETLKGGFVRDWQAFLSGMPQPLSKKLQHIGPSDADLVEKEILQAARAAWKQAHGADRLLPQRSQGWKEAHRAVLSGAGKCPLCFHKGTKIRHGDRGRMFRMESNNEVIVSPTELESHMRSLWNAHTELFALLFDLKGRSLSDDSDSPGHSRLFVRIVLVPPSRFRPTSAVGDMAYAAEHPQNLFFQRLLKEIEIIMTANHHGLEQDEQTDVPELDEETIKRPSKARFAQAMSNMQEALRDLYDSSGVSAGSGTVQMTGIRQQLEAKSGLFRQHMMGKRVDYSCRSVIGPDVFLDTNELGIPESFAKLLTVPDPVTAANLKEMQAAVLNGPDKYPGAVAIEDWTNNRSHRLVKFRSSEDRDRLKTQAGLLLQNHVYGGGRKQGRDSHLGPEGGLGGETPATRAIPKRVHRHLRTGDIVLFNRQPTLHRVSIMAHKVRVLPGERTLRFHYANCNSYNADFDGDEMNVHVPQDYLARAEAEELMLSSKHYIVPTSGAPVRGLIQDHIAAATLMSRRDTFMNREQFMQLLYSATEKLMNLPDRWGRKYVIPEPAVYKPQLLWTGKQLISTVLLVVRDRRPGINLDAKARTKANVIGTEEARVVFREGELLQGIIDKSSLGAAMYGIVHAVQEAYGCGASNDFLSAMSRLCVFFMRSHGHTTGIDDLSLRSQGEEKRRSIISSRSHAVGIDVTNSVYAEMSQDGKEIRTATSLSDARRLVEEMLRRDGKEAEDRLDTAMKTELNKVSSSVAKACVPASLQKSFPKNGFALMTDTGAKGSAVNSAQISCLLGSTVLEGKRVPRMGGGGATLPCFPPFDASPSAGGFISGRFLTGISPQEFFFHAMSGREGLLDTSLKTANSGYLQRCLVKHLEGIRLHYDYTVRNSDDSVVQFIYGDDGIDPSKSHWLSERIDWQLANWKCFENVNDSSGQNSGAVHVDLSLPREKGRANGTVLEELSPGALSRRGAVSEKFIDAIKATEKEVRQEDRENVRGLLERRYQMAALDPGEAVGVLAAQGVGEPSTQMTLNTFHHAGSSSAHVTLGIPRLRELLMTASRYPKTPSMTLPISTRNPKHGARRLCRRLQNISLLDLLLQIEIREDGIRPTPGFCEWSVRTLTLVLRFPPEELYREELGIRFKFIKRFVAESFLPAFHFSLKKEVQRVSSNVARSQDSALSMYARVAKKPIAVPRREEEPKNTDKEEQTSPDELYQTLGGLENEADDASDPGLASSSDEEGTESEENELEDQDTRKHAKALMEAHMNDSTEPAGNADASPGRNKSTRQHRKSKSRKVRSNGHLDENGHITADNDEVMDELLGYTPGSFRKVNKQTITCKWGVPVALCGKVDLAEIAREVARGLKLAEVARISKCFIESSASGTNVITEGSNVAAILEKGEGLVDFNRLETNDMFDILQTYGVEALRSALIQEFVTVFKVYGSPVNIRHLSLIADYMTIEGSYRAFSRLSMSGTPSPFQSMTFETSIKFLLDSALNGSDDLMKSPSAAIAMGQVYEGGTGGFQVMADLR